MGLTYVGTSQAVIDAPGDYTIDRDLTQNNPLQNCVIINPGVHYVTIRLRSRLVGAGGSGSINAGIHANGNAAVSLIGDGGNIRGFNYGVLFENTLIARMNGLFIQDALFRGISLSGDDPLIADNDIRDVHGAMWTPNAYCMGIEVSGMTDGGGKPKILRNMVQTVHGTGTGESVAFRLPIKDRARSWSAISSRTTSSRGCRSVEALRWHFGAAARATSWLATIPAQPGIMESFIHPRQLASAGKICSSTAPPILSIAAAT